MLVNGSWGFAATRDLTRPAVQALALDAVRTARAAAPVQKRPVVLAPVAPVVGTWQTPIAVDPSEVPIEDKIALLLKTNEAALGVKGVRFVNSSLAVLREEKTLATTDGTFTVQTFHRIGPQFTATAIASGDFQTYSHEIAPRGVGVCDGPRHGASRARVGRHRGREALGAQRDPWLVGSILEPTNLWLTIHESIGHPTELDRAMGYEANYAGRASSLRPIGTSASSGMAAS